MTRLTYSAIHLKKRVWTLSYFFHILSQNSWAKSIPKSLCLEFGRNVSFPEPEDLGKLGTVVC